MIVRGATEADIPVITNLYNAFIATRPIVWSETEQTYEERAAWLARQRSEEFPVLVPQAGGRVIGFTAYEHFRGEGKWPGYSRTVEHTIHVDQGHWRGGVAGRSLKLSSSARATPACTSSSTPSTARTTPRSASTSGSASSRSRACPRSVSSSGAGSTWS